MKDVHNYSHILETTLARTEKLSSGNQELIKKFVNNCELTEISKGRIAKYLNHLIKIAKWLEKDYDKAEKKDIEKLIIKIQNNGYTEWTKKDYKIAIKKFYKFLDKEELVSWIKTTIKKNNNENLPNEVYSEEEIEKLIEMADNPRDEAMISLLYESGCRISEFLNIKLKDITFEQEYAMINVMGKTGNRSIPISKSIPLLKTYLNYNKKGKEDYLFPLEYRNTSKIIKKLFKKAKIDKPCNPHQFRHSRATELAKKLTEAQMKQFFGWAQNSNMAGVYVHLTGRDLLPKLVIANETRKCLNCGFGNPIGLQFCSKCLMPLESKKYKKKMEKMSYENALTKVLSSNEKLKAELFKEMAKVMKK